MPIAITIIALIAVLGAGIFFISSSETPANSAVTPVETPATNRTETPARTDTPAEDMEMNVDAEVGMDIDPETTTSGKAFTSSASYLTPARTTHNIDVTLTVANGIVTDASVVYDKKEGFSNGNQERFNGAFKAEVVGKPLSTISLSRVGGASLTSEAFNTAVANIAAMVEEA